MYFRTVREAFPPKIVTMMIEPSQPHLHSTSGAYLTLTHIPCNPSASRKEYNACRSGIPSGNSADGTASLQRDEGFGAALVGCRSSSHRLCSHFDAVISILLTLRLGLLALQATADFVNGWR